MTTILMLWTVVTAAGGNSFNRAYYDWRPVGEFSTMASCAEAARQMGIKDNFRCVSK